jgi:Domain of unknown function (DUF4349)
MKLEDDLRERLSLEAGRLEPEEPSVGRLARRGRRRSRAKRAGIAVSVVALLGTAGVVGQFVLAEDPRPMAERSFSPVTGPQAMAPNEPPRGLEEPAPMPSGDLHFDQSTGGGGGSALQQSGVPPGVQVDIGIGPKVIKTARLRIEVDDGAFQSAFDRAESVADRFDGFITRSATSGQEARAGQLTLRVPATDFEAALRELKSIGMLRSEAVSGVDVTSDFVDLKARLRHRLAEERAVLRLLDQADTISETLTVRRVLDEVQLAIERLKGQLRLLRDQTSLGTIRVELHEEGVAPAEAAATENEIAGAWGRAIEGAEDVLVAVIVGLGYVLPIVVLLLLVWLALRAIRARLAT